MKKLHKGDQVADRIGVKSLADGKRVRFLKSNNEVLDVK
jgi:ribosomal protein L24